MIHSFAKVIVMDESIQPRGSETWLNFDVLSWQEAQSVPGALL